MLGKNLGVLLFLIVCLLQKMECSFILPKRTRAESARYRITLTAPCFVHLHPLIDPQPVRQICLFCSDWWRRQGYQGMGIRRRQLNGARSNGQV